jgi:hypothetical protein
MVSESVAVKGIRDYEDASPSLPELTDGRMSKGA